MKMSGFAIAASLVVGGLGAGAAAPALAAPHGVHTVRYDPHYGNHYDRGHRNYGRHDRWDRRHDWQQRRWNRGNRGYGYYGSGYGRQRCWVEWRHGRRVQVCR